MRKKMLMELKPLKVMNRHIADAKKTEISLSPLEKQRGEPGKYRMYCRAAVEKGILKVYLFAVTDIEENINFPRYRLFISRKERRFITYDEKLKKWRKTLLESILWKRMEFLLHVRLHITLNLKNKESLHSGEKNTIVSRNVVSRMA